MAYDREIEGKDLVTEAIIGAAIEVHRHLGPGLLDEAQLLTYMRHTGIKTGLLLNFNSSRLRDGLKRLSL